jgi:hypothetical protein
MPTLTEGNIHFDFPSGWQAVKYDAEGGFYRKTIIQHVQHIRGVDLLACPADAARLALIEVKDYREATTIDETLNAVLLETMLRKTIGTLAGLVAAERVQEPTLRPLAILSRQPSVEVVLFLIERPVVPVPTTTGYKLRRATQAVGRNDLELKLTAILATWGLEFKLRGSLPLQLPSVVADGWTVRVPSNTIDAA